MKKAIIVMAMLLVVGQAWAWKPKFVSHTRHSQVA